MIASYCEEKTKDNYSGYLIQVVENEAAFSMEVVEKENFKWVKVALLIITLIIMCLLGSKFLSEQTQKTDPQTKIDSKIK
jgi:hypothetical protein